MPRTPKDPSQLEPARVSHVKPLQVVPAQPTAGRPKKLRMPPLPKELLDGMSPLEQEHFQFFIQAVRLENPDLLPSDLIALNMAGLNYINSLRLQQSQLSSGELVTMSRQHPEVQMRAWLDLMSVSRKQRAPGKSAEELEREQSRMKLMQVLGG